MCIRLRSQRLRNMTLSWTPKDKRLRGIQQVLKNDNASDISLGMLEVKAYYIAAQPHRVGPLLSLLRDYPIDELKHLKRVKRIKTSSHLFLHVLIGTNNTVALFSESLESIILEYAIDGKFSIAEVPRAAPSHRRDMDVWKSYWPVSAVPDKPKPCWPVDHEPAIVECMLRTIAMANDNLTHGRIPVSAMVWCPIEKKVIAEVKDVRSFPQTLNDHLLHHAVMDVIRAVSVVNRSIKNKKRSKGSKQDEVPSSIPWSKDPYLCRGLVLFTTHEPCTMCAMALLHSRFSQVFYSFPQAEGALGSHHRLHVDTRLNHRFDVFSMVMTQEAIQSLGDHSPDMRACFC